MQKKIKNDSTTLSYCTMKKVNPSIQFGVQTYKINIQNDKFSKYDHNVNKIMDENQHING